MFVGKLAGAALGFWLDPGIGWLIGAMLGHLVDLPLGRWLSARRSQRERQRAQRRERRRTIHQVGVQARGDQSRAEQAAAAAPQEPATVRNALVVLGVQADAPRDAVKARWRHLVREWHPDSRQARGLIVDTESSERLFAIQRAWEVLREARGWR